MSSLERAIGIAVIAHPGQRDKGGEPYIAHPLRVMLRMTTEEKRIVAVLHDAVEDPRFTFEDLLAAGITSPVVSALEALTKLPGGSDSSDHNCRKAMKRRVHFGKAGHFTRCRGST